MTWRFRAKNLSVINPGSTTDDYGNVTPDWGSGATTTTERGLIQEAESTEVTSGRDTVVTTLRAILPVNSVAVSHSRIVANGKTYEVIGDPIVYNTGSPGVRHTECHLVTFTG